MNKKAINKFESQILGEVLQPRDEGYEEARSIWNAMIDKNPAAIVQCIGVADVIKCVNFARDYELPLAIRGGGHNVAGNAICDDGLVIDLSQMKGIQVNPESKTARVEGGVTWREFDHETQAFGLATPSGVVSTTGVAGLTLGGGFGRLSRKYGLTADNLISADVVTADGELITASESENVDLFWGLRGGSGNFGVVTSFEFQLHEVGPEVLFGPIVYRYEDVVEVLRNYREFALNAPMSVVSGWISWLLRPCHFCLKRFTVTPWFLSLLFTPEILKRGRKCWARSVNLETLLRMLLL